MFCGLWVRRILLCIALVAVSHSPSVLAQGGTAPNPRFLVVQGSRVPLRAEPFAAAEVLDRLNDGQEVEEIDRRDGWVNVRHALSKQVGWIPSARLSEKKEPQDTPTPKETPNLTQTAIIALIIERSVSAYRASRPCACPYNTDRAGRACGSRSAWSRPGGAKPICYPTDITQEMIAGFRP